MESHELLTQIAAALASDSALDAWCDINLPSPPGVWIGINSLNPPRQSAYPLIAITDIRTTGEALRGEVTHAVDIACGVVSESIEISGTITTHAGMILAEKFRAEVKAALLRSRIGKITIHGDAGQIEAHPIYISGMTTEIITQTPQRRT